MPMTRELYDAIWNDAGKVRQFLQAQIQQSPELFPGGVENGFQLTGHLPESRKIPGVRLRQLRLSDGGVFTLRPSFVTRYMTGTVEELENPLLLLSFGVPHWVVTRIFGHNDMYWYRQVEALGRNSLVGTTVRDPERLPEHLAGDEHHGDWSGEKGYVAFVAGGGCMLGAAESAGFRVSSAPMETPHKNTAVAQPGPRHRAAGPHSIPTTRRIASSHRQP